MLSKTKKNKFIQTLKIMIKEELLKESVEFKSGDELQFTPQNYKELDSLRKNGTGMEALYSATQYPNNQIYIFKNYDGSTAVVYPKGKDRNRTFRVNKDRFQLNQ